MEKNVFDVYSADELKDMKKTKMLENLEKITNKNIFDLNTTKKYKQLIMNCKTIDELNVVEKEMTESKNLQIRKKIFLNYVIDYHENHMITKTTKDICINTMLNVMTLEELEQIEVQLESIIRDDSKRIISEYEELRKKYIVEDIIKKNK